MYIHPPDIFGSFGCMFLILAVLEDKFKESYEDGPEFTGPPIPDMPKRLKLHIENLSVKNLFNKGNFMDKQVGGNSKEN